jgi:hypothetical protein
VGYLALRRSFADGPVAQFPYRLFDARFEGNRLSFWVSLRDPWDDWCSLQTPYRAEAFGATWYQCVPQGASSPPTNFGKLLLCTHSGDGRLCSVEGGFEACTCLDAQGRIDYSLLGCSASYCQCTSAGCTAAFRTSALFFDLVLEGNELTGTLRFDELTRGESAQARFRRAGP